MAKLPQPLSPGEEEFAMHCKLYKLEPVREFSFHPTRNWKFDFAFIDNKIAVEVEGGTRGNGRHNRHSGFTADCHKYNSAVLMGWKLFRFTTEMVHSGNAIDTVMEVINGSSFAATSASQSKKVSQAKQ